MFQIIGINNYQSISSTVKDENSTKREVNCSKTMFMGGGQREEERGRKGRRKGLESPLTCNLLDSLTHKLSSKLALHSS